MGSDEQKIVSRLGLGLVGLKYVSLLTLTLQNSIFALSIRHSRTRAGDMFIASSAVIMTEIVKLVVSLILVYNEEGCNLNNTLTSLHKCIIKQPIDTLKVCVPSLLYIFQNNLLYLSASHLDAATYQVTYQMKILTTAVFAVLILRRSLFYLQWVAILNLIVGIILVQLAYTDTPVANGIYQNRLIGFSAALAASCLSGFAGIYFEKILKGSELSLWMRNVQLSFLSLPFGLGTCLANDWQTVFEKGFFYGYDAFVIYLVVLQAIGGLAVAMVVKYADSILKGFASSLAIIIASVASVYFFNFQITMQFAIGAALVICSIFMYSYRPNRSSASQGAKITS